MIFEVLGAVAAVGDLAGYARQGWDRLRKAQPEYHWFWGQLEKRLKPEGLDVPWQEITDKCRLSPEFISCACHLIRGDYGSLQKIEAMIRADLTPPEGSRYDSGEMTAVILEAVKQAAFHAPRDLQASFAQTYELITGFTGVGFAFTSEQIAQVMGAVQDLDQKMSQIQATAERIQATTDKIEVEPGQVPDPGETSPPGPNTDVDEERRSNVLLLQPWALAPLAVGADLAASIEELVAALEVEDPDGAARIRQMLEEGGAQVVVQSLRAREGPEDDGVPFLITVARIARRTGAFAAAEAAYVWASEVRDIDERTRARQLVRAAAMAEQRDKQRATELLQRARALVPDHPALAISEARTSTDPQWVLDHLREVQPEQDQESALMHSILAHAHLVLNQFEQARQELEQARDADETHPAIAEIGSVLTILNAKRALADDRPADNDELREAATALRKLREDQEAEGSWEASASLRAREGEALALTGDFERAAELLGEVKHLDFVSADGRIKLAEAAMVARAPSLAIELAPPESSSDEARLLQAEAASFSDDSSIRIAAAAALRDLIGHEDPRLAEKAAYCLLATCWLEKDVEWDERAEDLLKAEHPVITAVFHAGHLRLLGELDEAERLLLPHSSHLQPLRGLRDIASERQEWQKASDRSRSILRLNPAPLDRFIDAQILVRVDETETARDRFREIARDETADVETRRRAFAALCELASGRDDFAQIEATAREWHTDWPDDENATWNLLYAFVRQCKYNDALQLWRSASPEAKTPQQGHVAAMALLRAAPVDEALVEIERLSSRFDRKNERLEALLIVTTLQADDVWDRLPDEFAAELRQRFQSFTTRFPDSSILRALPAPQSAEDFDALMKQLHGRAAERQREISDQIRDGQLPVNLLAMATSTRASAMWGRIGALPLGYSIPMLDEQDREAAREAIGGAAVWDTSAIFIAGGLGPELEQTATAALPGSLIANETREDADAALGAFLPNAAGQTGFDPETGHAWLRDVPPEESDREQYRLEGVLRITNELEARSAHNPGGAEPLREMLSDEDLDPAVAPLVASVLLAQQLHRPLFSDDRWVRQAARSYGVPSFGTLALLDELQTRGLLTDEERAQARRKLAASGAWGLSMAAEEMAAAARETEWDVNRATTGALFDRAAWRAGPAERMQELAKFLQAAHADSPEHIELWVHRVLDAAAQLTPQLAPAVLAQYLLVLSWNTGNKDSGVTGACFQEMIKAARSAPFWPRAPNDDPMLGALGYILSYWHGRPDTIRFHMFCLLIRRLTFPDQMLAWRTFIAG